MEIQLRGHEKRTRAAKELWLRMATDLINGMEPKDIAKKYTNPYTKKPYTREHIYKIIRRLRETAI